MKTLGMLIIVRREANNPRGPSRVLIFFFLSLFFAHLTGLFKIFVVWLASCKAVLFLFEGIGIYFFVLTLFGVYRCGLGASILFEYYNTERMLRRFYKYFVNWLDYTVVRRFLGMRRVHAGENEWHCRFCGRTPAPKGDKMRRW